ncbi:autotransporter outer membrane beta-barrel domain-containing protein [Candidatus Hamiltonella defensa]|uniref:autotransporter outer membrane beta-barrel domain-containing protein n=1 Tax=Candidatus Williamhamiltonella defendens TaxID=138072 RepID=UPI0020C6F3E9|nr:autotransporter outer membrane beta-barrel domain-containing protein [Candidatus Hamiltonella defensa]
MGGKGGATKGGIRLIEAKEGTDGTFVQDGPIVAGSYQYSLRHEFRTDLVRRRE